VAASRTVAALAERAEPVAAEYRQPGYRSAAAVLQAAVRIAAAALPVEARLVAVAQVGPLAVARNWGIHCKQEGLHGRIAGISR